MPETTAPLPAVDVIVTVTEPLAETLTLALTQAPRLKADEMSALCAPEPSLIDTVSRRAVVSQSIR
jgi:hypothetical protein